MTPGPWLGAERLERVRLLLETGHLPMDQIAARAGFVTASSFRHHFRTPIGISLSAYRRTYPPAKVTPSRNS